MAFGKRKTFGDTLREAELPVGEDGRGRVKPDAVCEGESGEFMKKLGLSPDDPSNIIPTPEDIVARYRAAENAERDVIEKSNNQYAGILHGDDRILPLYAIPLEVWDSHVNITLVAHLDLLPFDEWNRLWLPTGPMSALIMNSFPHPGKEPKWMYDNAMAFIEPCLGQFHEKMRDVLDCVDPTREQINSGIEAKNTCNAEIKAFAHLTKHRLVEAGTSNFKQQIKAGAT